MRIDDIFTNKEIIEQLYDIARIINPINKEIIDIQYFRNYGKKIPEKISQNYCYEFWGDEGACENCCSTRAYNQKQVYMKTEFNGKDVYMVTSLPYDDDGEIFILEVISEITDKDLLNEIQGKDYFQIKNILKKKNQEIVQDELTKAYNRKFINERLPFEMVDKNKFGTEMLLAMADIDFFKKVNDTYGHDMGDFVLVEFVKLINGNIRQNIDWISRYGGEEFLIFMKNISKDQAYQKLDSIRKKIENHVFEFNGQSLSITCSFGLSQLKAGEVMESWIKRADENMYFSKNNGRNQISVDKETK